MRGIRSDDVVVVAALALAAAVCWWGFVASFSQAVSGVDFALWVFPVSGLIALAFTVLTTLEISSTKEHMR